LPGDSPATRPARAGAPIKANDGRQDYLRATLAEDDDGHWIATPFGKQDSSMMSSLAAAGALIVRPPRAEAVPAGGALRIIPLGL
jgi:molybdopterin molybdotransferase